MMAMRVTSGETSGGVPTQGGEATERSSVRSRPAPSAPIYAGRPRRAPRVGRGQRVGFGGSSPHVSTPPRRRVTTVARPSHAGAALVFVLAGFVAALGTAWFQRICAAEVSLDDIGAFNALLALAGG